MLHETKETETIIQPGRSNTDVMVAMDLCLIVKQPNIIDKQ